MEAVMLLTAVPLLILNMLGGVVGAIGLAVQGKWALLFGGLAWCFCGAFVLSIALMPAMACASLAVRASSRGNTLGVVLATAPSLLWTCTVVAISSVFVFYNVIARVDSGVFHLLWGYSVTTAPWSYLANKDKQVGNDSSVVLMFFVQLGVVAMMVVGWTDAEQVTFMRLLGWFSLFMLVGFASQMFIAVVESRSVKYRRF